jgi:hypothetical protein
MLPSIGAISGMLPSALSAVAQAAPKVLPFVIETKSVSALKTKKNG